MNNKAFQRKLLAHNLHGFNGMARDLYYVLSQTEYGDETMLKHVESEEGETEKELMFLPLNLHQCLENWADGAKNRLYWAEFAQKYGETVATVATLGWVLHANDYEQAIWLSAVGLMRKYGLGLTDYTIASMVLLHIGESNPEKKIWGLVWGLDYGPEIRINVAVDLADEKVRFLI